MIKSMVRFKIRNQETRALIRDFIPMTLAGRNKLILTYPSPLGEG